MPPLCPQGVVRRLAEVRVFRQLVCPAHPRAEVVLFLGLSCWLPDWREMRALAHAVQGIKRPELRDELYMQLLKQSRGNTTPSCAKVPPLTSHTLHPGACNARVSGTRAAKRAWHRVGPYIT